MSTRPAARVPHPHSRPARFGISTISIHLGGDALSPVIIGVASTHFGLKLPILVTGMLLLVAGVVLLAGRAALKRDLRLVDAA